MAENSNRTLPLWQPDPQRVQAAQLTAFLQWLDEHRGQTFPDYESLWRWSTEQQAPFWECVWDYFGIKGRRFTEIRTTEGMPHTRWFVGAELNFVSQVFARSDLQGPALIHESESAAAGELSWPQLRRQVAALAHCLRERGIGRGDRVVACLPNIPQAIVGLLATASVGAVWSVCGPEFGAASVIERFRQIAPRLLLACDGYRHGGRSHERRAQALQLLDALSSVETLIWIPHLDPLSQTPPDPAGRRIIPWSVAVAGEHELNVQALPADHPLWILYSSGTSGPPKAIVHGHAGITVNGTLTVHVHNDLRPGDRVYLTSSTSWMVWNAHVMCLLAGATLVLYDGSPTGSAAAPDWNLLWRLAERHRVSLFGAGAAYYQACRRAGVRPCDCCSLPALRTVLSTGSPLPGDGYRWILDAVGEQVWINSISGGTDICGAFLGGVPTLPVYEGEMPCRVLGAAVQAFDDSGHAVMDAVGELVCVAPLPSMPLQFWGDPDGTRYRDSYFDTFHAADGSGVWRHGDWIRLVPRPGATGAIIYGRSDATINRQGVRMGSAEIYRVVESFDAVQDSLVIDLEYLGRESRLLLFVVLTPGLRLDENLRESLRKSLRTYASPRHVPDEIVQAPQVPRTLTGKKLEVPVKRLLLGHPPAQVVSRDALFNPASLDWYLEFARKIA